MQCENEYGLNDYARGYTQNVPATVYEVQDGAYTPNLLHLRRFNLSDGQTVEEFVQVTPWSGGPCYFLALRDAETLEPIAESLWSDDVISRLTRSGRL